jgi:hypothetical protein
MSGLHHPMHPALSDLSITGQHASQVVVGGWLSGNRVLQPPKPRSPSPQDRGSRIPTWCAQGCEDNPSNKGDQRLKKIDMTKFPQCIQVVCMSCSPEALMSLSLHCSGNFSE